MKVHIIILILDFVTDQKDKRRVVGTRSDLRQVESRILQSRKVFDDRFE